MKFLKISFYVLLFYTVLNVSSAFASTGTMTGVTFTSDYPSTAHSICYRDNQPLNTTFTNDFTGSSQNDWYGVVGGSYTYSVKCASFDTAISAGNGLFWYNFDYTNAPTALNYLGSFSFNRTGYTTSANFSFTSALPPPPPTPTGTNAGIFFPKDTVTGDTTANLLTASVIGATGTTTKSMTPVLAVVAGIILAFIGINWVVGLVYGTDDTKKKNKV